MILDVTPSASGSGIDVATRVTYQGANDSAAAASFHTKLAMDPGAVFSSDTFSAVTVSDVSSPAAPPQGLQRPCSAPENLAALFTYPIRLDAFSARRELHEAGSWLQAHVELTNSAFCACVSRSAAAATAAWGEFFEPFGNHSGGHLRLCCPRGDSSGRPPVDASAAPGRRCGWQCRREPADSAASGRPLITEVHVLSQ